ncbi:MAG TPA: VOC family protein [Dehalococcoidia bacterium]|nr:VOC family protein [Dehalococcoidia bacterium]
MQVDFDHAHIFASNLNETVRFFREMFGAEIVWDADAAGARNVRLAIGRGFVHLYDQPPTIDRPGNIHHLGIETDDLDALVSQMQAKGFAFRKPIQEHPTFRYVMVAAPDNILIEVFQIRNRAEWRLK